MEIKWNDTNLPGVRVFRTKWHEFYFSAQVFGATLEICTANDRSVYERRVISRQFTCADEPLTDLQLLGEAEKIIRWKA